MPGRSPSAKIVVALLVILVLVGSGTPAYAWKVKTHVHSANLILQEIAANNGYVEIKPYGKFRVLPEYKQALDAYPEYFRAGSLAPDLIPDMVVGQTLIHPYASGEMVYRLWEEMRELPNGSTALPSSDAASRCLRMDNKQQVLAFMLGFQAHAAGDYFGHAYINRWAKGEWPTISSNMSGEDVKKIIRHVAVESYIDKMIPRDYMSTLPPVLKPLGSIAMPQTFVFNNMVTNGGGGGVPNYENVAYDSRFFSDLSCYGPNDDDTPAHMKLFFDLRAKLKQEIRDLDNKMGTVAGYLSGLLTLDGARKEYMRAWVKDIDEGLAAWVGANETAAKAMLGDYQALKAYKQALTEWATSYLPRMLGAPDVAVSIITAIGDVAEWVDSLVSKLLPAWLRTLMNDLKRDAVNTLFTLTFGMSYSQIEAIIESPETYLNRTDLFPSGTLEKLNKEMGNFSTSRSATDQTFVPFYNTLNLTKLILIGEPGLAELRRVSGSTGTAQGMLVRNMPSMDFGYQWVDDYQRLVQIPVLTNSNDDRVKICDRVFFLKGFSPMPILYDMTPGPITIVPNKGVVNPTTGVVDSEFRVSVKFKNLPAEPQMYIALYRDDGSFDPSRGNLQSFTLVNKEGVFTRQIGNLQAGRLRFMVSDGHGTLYAVSDPLQVNEQQSDGQGGLKPPTTGGGSLVGPAGPGGQLSPPLGELVGFTVRATAGAGYVLLDWGLSPDANVEGYHVFRATTPGGYTSTPETDFWMTSNTYTDTKVTAGTEYYYVVRPVYRDGSLRAPSNEVSATPEGGSGNIQLTIGNPMMRINGVSREIDPGKGTAPEIKDGRTVLPIRAVIEEMSGIVGWDGNERKVTLQWNGNIVEMWIDKTGIKVNGFDKVMDVAPYISQTGRTMLPLRFVGENLGCVVSWDGATKTATIVYSTREEPEQQPGSGRWAGNWGSVWGVIRFTQQGSEVSGTYGDDTPPCTISGTVTGNTFRGHFDEPGSHGQVVFVMSSDGNSLDGRWKWSEEDQDWADDGSWSEWDAQRVGQ